LNCVHVSSHAYDEEAKETSKRKKTPRLAGEVEVINAMMDSWILVVDTSRT